MPTPPKKKTLHSRIFGLWRRTLPRTWVLRIQLRGIDRLYGPLVAQAEGDERESLIGEHIYFRDEIEEQLEGIRTRRLRHRAKKYPTVGVPAITMRGPHGQDENWEEGHASGEWYLKPAAFASVWLQIEDAQRRRWEMWESRVKVIGGVLPWLTAVLSLLVSLILAWRR